MERIISISTVAYDGHPLFDALEHIKKLNISHVELAFIEGYIDEYSEDTFTPEYAHTLRRRLGILGLSCYALSAHMDLGSHDAVLRFMKRLEFAAGIGAGVILTSAAPRKEEKTFFRNIAPLLERAKDLNLVIALENPGDGTDNLINTGKDGAALIKKINSTNLRLNYDFGNLISHTYEKIRPEDDFKYAVDYCAHLHMKDVQTTDDGWDFPSIGSGEIDYRMIIQDIPEDLPFSLEVPARLRRKKDATPFRVTPPPALDIVDRMLKESLYFIRETM